MTRDQFLSALENLNVWEQAGVRAPHQPLLLLFALGRMSQPDRLIRYADLEAPLKGLLKTFGPPRDSYGPQYPFWHLRSTGLWEVPDGEKLPLKKGGRSPRVSTLKDADAKGRFVPEVDQLLRHDPELVERAAVMLLNGHFPQSYHTPIRDAVGLTEPMAQEASAPYGGAPRRKRDPQFRLRVLAAYEQRCAICDFDVRLDNDLLGLDAAHIQWHAAGGPDSVPNGLALCKLHHHALDRGAIGLDASGPECKILVSDELSGMSVAVRHLRDFSGGRLRPPQDPSQAPASGHIAWHRGQVFRGEPLRASSANRP